MAKRSITRQPTLDTRHSSPVDNDPGFLAVRLEGLSDLVRAVACGEQEFTTGAALFVAGYLDDVAARLEAGG